ncbi:hypothetical protein EYC80_006488 [Monilinia laxa]|uniref:Uncharacterized protein n=1 Tax=Monilinia laxa TaxID=61186 RepID=A0A5N6JS37_MONLA|nr:hypothetical protein EYC80_006488 [Monilinia laxa]
MVTITLDPDYGYVILAATSTFVLNVIHGINTGTYRKAAKVDYPAAYAPASRTDPEAHRFNCAQRAHANFTENHSIAVSALLISGLQFPKTAALLGGAWSTDAGGSFVALQKDSSGLALRGRFDSKVLLLKVHE